MATKVVSQEALDQPILRRKSVAARNQGGMKTILDYGEAGRGATDEPVSQGGSGEGVYAFVTHSFADAAKGAVGLIRVGEPNHVAGVAH